MGRGEGEMRRERGWVSEWVFVLHSRWRWVGITYMSVCKRGWDCKDWNHWSVEEHNDSAG